MLKKNLNNGQACLCNGALGTVKSFNYGKDQSIISLNILFDNLNEEYQLLKVSHDYEYSKNIYVTRTQFPVSVAWALTIHKTQGLSLESAIIDIGTDIFEPGMAYVALSRIKKLKNVHLVAFDPLKLACDEASIKEYNRLCRKFGKGSYIEKFTKWNKSLNQKSQILTKDLISLTELKENGPKSKAESFMKTTKQFKRTTTDQVDDCCSKKIFKINTEKSNKKSKF